MDFDPIKHRDQIRLASGLDFLAGVWLILSPFVLHFEDVRNAAAINGFFGILIAFLAAARMFAYMFPSVSWVNVIFGIWILVSPFCVGFYIFHVPLVNNIISGIVVIILASWSALANRPDRHNRIPDPYLANIPTHFPPGG